MHSCGEGHQIFSHFYSNPTPLRQGVMYLHLAEEEEEETEQGLLVTDLI